MKKAILIPLGILCLFIITNPSVSAFKTYRGRESYQGLYRPVNLFVLSEYKDRGSEFIGVMGNFILVKKPVAVQVVETPPIENKSYMADTTKRYDEYGILIRKK